MADSKIKGLIVLEDSAWQRIYGPELTQEIERRVDLLAPPMSCEELAAKGSHLAETEVIFSGWGGPRLDAAFLEAAPRLRVLFYGAGSVRNTVTEASWARGVEVTSAYAMNAVPVSEYTLATVLFSLKQGWRFAAQMKLQRTRPLRTPVAGAYGSTVGLVSLGMIGRLVRERLRSFDVKVLAYDPYISPAVAQDLNVEAVSLEELFARSDVVSLHTPWLPETEGMVRGAHFAAMKPDATFINTARGAVVQEAEMIDVLTQRPDLMAVLDVTHPEPPVPESPLYTLPNVVLTPHIAGSLDGECRRMGRLMIDEFDRWQRGEPMKWALSARSAAVLA